MQVHQILIRTHDSSVTVVYIDLGGRRNSLVFDGSANAAVRDLVAECQRRLPPDDQNPAKAEIEREIADLSARLGRLKQSIGQQ
jgi:hypothetical protein